ncbi:MAG: spore germination protein [Candidatus Improbicoccus devescovinae]|nr:MAG: spore germination protein [Candidatus Improbicoccus devescovinae]
MLSFLKKIVSYFSSDTDEINEKNNKLDEKHDINKNLDKNIAYFKQEFSQSADLVVREIKIFDLKAAIITMDGLIDKNMFSSNVMKVLMYDEISNKNSITNKTPNEIFNYVRDNLVAFPDQIEVNSYEDALNFVTAGFALLALDKHDKILAIGAQGFSIRGLSEPTSEKSQRGSRDGFIEVLRINITLIRRRIRSPKLKFETLIVGSVSKTYVCLCYMTDLDTSKIVEKIKKRLSNPNIKTVTTAGCLSPYLEKEGDLSLFSSIGFSERPDTICGKISEGRIAVLIDGTPTVLVAPYLFVEHFHNIDDYALRPYFVSLNRILKFAAFFIAILLPGLYVGLGTFNPELFPGELLNKIALATGSTPFSLMLETLIIHFIYEIMREAGLRLPQSLAHAVSIVGGLVIGDAAINSGLIGAPTLMVIALTTISSYVIPNLYEPITFLRLLFILAGGMLGIWGIMIVFSAILVNICAKSNFDIPFTAPISPFNLFGMRDVFFRFSWKILYKKINPVKSMPGTKKY